MRIIHTSDWHLGKMLEGNSRFKEQEEFVQEFIEITKREKPDMVIIAGDIYDTSNPLAKAEKLFYKAIKEITKDDKTIVLAISGNHDNPDRLEASMPIAYNQGIILLGTARSIIQIGKCGCGQVVDAGEGYFEIEINNERAVILTMPYPSEKRLNEIISDKLDENERQLDYSKRLGSIFKNLSEKFRDDTINLAVSHLFTLGGENSDSERLIQLGGSLTVNTCDLPNKAQYIALGHLHKPQKVIGMNGKARYSGSPIQYSKSERNNANCAYIIDIKANEEPEIREVYFRNYKPIEVWKCESISDAIEKCKENSNMNSWVYLEIKTDKVLSQEEIKEMKKYKDDIVEIRPIIENEDEEITDFSKLTEKNIEEIFKEFYKHEKNGLDASKELIDMFLKIVNEDGDEDETNVTEN